MSLHSFVDFIHFLRWSHGWLLLFHVLIPLTLSSSPNPSTDLCLKKIGDAMPPRRLDASDMVLSNILRRLFDAHAEPLNADWGN